MGKIIISENITLDGIVEDPTGGEGLRNGGWFESAMTVDREPWAAVEFAEARAASALLLGRGTDHYFGQRWNDLPGEWADTLRALPKYVVSSTLTETVWKNGTVLSGDVVEEAKLLKDRIDGEIVVYGSRPLVRTLLQNDLVDELRLFVFPVIVGEGEPLFAALGVNVTLRRRQMEKVGEALIHQIYEVVR
ncbi:MAG: dihydrofolate reductase family protein [Marmoricola sp.]